MAINLNRLCSRLSVFNSSIRRWRTVLPITPQRQSLVLISWNIDAFSIRNITRARGILDHILQGPKTPDIIFLQEVTLEVRDALLSDERVRNGFFSTDAEDNEPFEGVPFATMILLSCARFRFASDLGSQEETRKLLVGPTFRQMLPSRFKRDALCVDIISPASPGTILRLINVHLDSLKDTERHRRKQLKILADVLREPACGRGLIAGDFNAIGLEDKELVEENNLVDAWVKLYGTGIDGHTWSVGVTRHDGLQPGRLDKIAMVGLEATEMEVLRPGSISVPKPGGKEGEIPLSDHCGLRCVFNI